MIRTRWRETYCYTVFVQRAREGGRTVHTLSLYSVGVVCIDGLAPSWCSVSMNGKSILVPGYSSTCTMSVWRGQRQADNMSLCCVGTALVKAEMWVKIRTRECA